jgi:UTP--glucose-1-phosphate uridylyltransferase
MTSKVRKAVFPVAGLGTRFLPATKAIPKEMLPIVDRPVIQYAVQEALEAGIEQIIFVTGRGKTAIEDHFDHAFELQATLQARGKQETLEILLRDIPGTGRITMTRQQEPLGLGHAIWSARYLVGNEPFAVSLPDVLTDPKKNALAQLTKAYERVGGNLLTLKNVAREEVRKYGIAALGEKNGDLVRIKGMVEKPEPDKAPSTLHILGRYILQPDIFDEIERSERGAGGEIWLTDPMARLAERQPFHGAIYDGDFYDCGDKLGFLKATVALALDRKDLKDEFSAFLRERLSKK